MRCCRKENVIPVLLPEGVSGRSTDNCFAAYFVTRLFRETDRDAAPERRQTLIPPGVFDFFPVFVEFEFGAVFVVVAFFAEMVFRGVFREHHLPAG